MGRGIFEFHDGSPWKEDWANRSSSLTPSQLSETLESTGLPKIYKADKKSQYKILLFGGVDYFNDGSYGTNLKLGEYLEILSSSEKYSIPLSKGDIRIVNSPLFTEELEGKDVYDDIIKIIKSNFAPNNGNLILYGYSWGGQMLMEFLKFFNKSNIEIDLLITIDAAKGPLSFAVNNDVTSNVRSNLNIYQTKPSAILSKGGPNEGRNVVNVDLTGEKNKNGEDIVHSNIDEYTLLYSAQIILNALKGTYDFKFQSINKIKSLIKTYASHGY